MSNDGGTGPFPAIGTYPARIPPDVDAASWRHGWQAGYASAEADAEARVRDLQAEVVVWREEAMFALAALNDPEALGEEGKRRLRHRLYRLTERELWEGDPAPLATDAPAPAGDARPRWTCICGRTVLAENRANHLLRQNGGRHGDPDDPADPACSDPFCSYRAEILSGEWVRAPAPAGGLDVERLKWIESLAPYMLNFMGKGWDRPTMSGHSQPDPDSPGFYEPLTISPSLACPDEKCGWHVHVRDGRVVT